MKSFLKNLLPRLDVVLTHHSIKANHFTARWTERNIQGVSIMLKIHCLMKDDKVLESLTNLCDVLLLKDIRWDEIDNEQIEKVKSK